MPTQDQTTALFNKAQEVLLTTYSTGDFEHILTLTTAEAIKDALANCGDGLLRFLMVELSDAEDCENLDDAVDRVSTAIDDLQALQRNLGIAQQA